VEILPLAQVDWQDGAAFAPEFGDVFHSRDGALGQAQQVFLGNNGLPQRWRGRRQFCIAETGFGGGVNFLCTWAAWRADPERPARLHYVAAEWRPWAVADLRRLHADGALAPLAEALIARWPPPFAGFHLLELDGGAVRLLLLWGDARQQFTELDARIDALYLDGFAPDRDPGLWSPALLTSLAARCAPDATAASYSIAAPVRAALAAAGFGVERRPGFGRKRDSLHAHRDGAPTAKDPAPRRIRILGAGIAGTTLAAALAQRGHPVILQDPAARPGAGASGNPRALIRPWLSREDSPSTQLTRAAFLYARQRGLAAAGAAGVIQLPRHAADRQRFAEILDAQRPPADWVHAVDRDAASTLAGQALPEGGLYFPQGFPVDPAALCRAGAASTGVDWRPGTPLTTLAGRDPDEILILACAHGAAPLLPGVALPMSRVRGQLSLLPAASLPQLRRTVARDGYVIPTGAGGAVVGATYERFETPSPTVESHARNLLRLAQLLREPPALDPAALAGRVGFRAVFPDRLPAIGPVPGWEGVWLASGYASRGVVWAGLLADTLAAALGGEPSPLPRTLRQALAPARLSRFRSPA
jgi:tRNA 5-methylaminomethyl-2-thiouridine biosynthesis bifunctional protein